MPCLQRLSVSSVFLAVLAAGVGGEAGGQNSSTSAIEAQTTIRAVSEGIILDVVVRDRSGRPVLDLRPEEIEVFEDGVRQVVRSFRFVGQDQAAASPQSGRPAQRLSELERRPPVDPFRHLNLVALVFERLPDTARQMAREAALHFVDAAMPENTLVAVFAIDNSLLLVEHYTNDREALRAGIRKATSGAYGQFDSQSTDTIQGQMQELTRRTDRDQEAAAVLGGRSFTPSLLELQESELEEMTLNVLRQAERMMLYQRGHATITSLRALVREEGKLAGRKTLVLFSAGIQIPHEVVTRYHQLVSEANRANVSIYTVDARGLHTEDMMADVRYALSQAVAASRSQMLTGLGRMVTRDETLIDQYAETAIRLNGYGTLDNLARSTGGFLLANTNDPRELIARVGEDIRSYYEVAYTPSVLRYDGRFRQIVVRVSRPGVTVQSRSGYFALPPEVDAPIQAYEIPMLVALNSDAPAADFEHRSRVLHFEPSDRGERLVVIVEVPLGTFHFAEDPAESLYRSRFSIMALIKDPEGRVVEKFTQDYPLQGPLEKLDLVRGGSVVFQREIRLEPGHYTLETAVVDQLASRLSTRRSRLQVNHLVLGPQLSSVVIIRRVDPVRDSQSSTPLSLQDGVVVPNLAGIILGDSGDGVGVFCVVYPDRDSSEPIELTLQVMKDGLLVAQGRPQLPPPDHAGAIRFAGTVPVDGLPPGRYELQALVRQGTRSSREHAFFVLAGPSDPEALSK